MIELYDAMSAEVRAAPIACQQVAFALNRRNRPGDRERAVDVLQRLLKANGDSAETLEFSRASTRTGTGRP